MDPEVWKWQKKGFKIINNQKGIFVSKMLQENHSKHIPTERLLKNPSNIFLREESVKEEDAIINVNEIANCYFKSPEQGEMVKSCVRQRKTSIFKSSDQFADIMPNSKGYRKHVALLTSGTESQRVTKLPSEVENKRLPILVDDVGHTFISQRQERSSMLYRQDGMLNDNEVRNLVSNHCSNTKCVRPKKEAFFQGREDICSQDTHVHHGFSFNNSTKRAILHNNVQHHSDTVDKCKRINISDDRSSVHKVCQKMFNHHHQVPRRQISPESGELTYSDFTSSVTCKTTKNSMQKNRCRHSSTDEMKEGLANFKEKNTSEESSTRRFLLIDSRGLPYTVVVEEPRSISLRNSTGESPLTGVSKSSAPRKVYKCPVCFRIFEYLSYLQRHSIAHSQQKPHVCKVCGKAFKRTSHLTRHKYTHFGGKPCQCQICERRFRDIGELTRHQQSHTGEKRN
ncbi:uncharacterized protein ACNLHF_001862 isoform 1-T2 [Anomaloglossus baeobatrachus]|uniref:uncharacterized protein LOC142256720 n=1 Tax=Anomaloglossus baeobatrachus TaxID=238106 RepID=UPI003F4F40D2